jgi:uncharacterized protein (TIGR00255 family)
MTGYGEAAAQGRWVKVVVQLRTLNHRHLDLQPRLPKEYYPIEEEVRKLVRQRISRGRTEIFITRAPLAGQGRRLELDERLVSQYLRSLRRVKRKFALKGELDLSLCSNLPELFHLREAEVREEDEKELVLKALHRALKNLERSREREGSQIQSDVQGQVRHLRRLAAQLDREAIRIGMRIKESLSPKEGEGAPESAPRSKDDANSTFRGEIHEEAVRLKSHVQELGRLIRDREPVGKRIEFLLQEIQRELNTVSSKAPQLSVVRLVVAGKERVEKIREQAQNIE